MDGQTDGQAKRVEERHVTGNKAGYTATPVACGWTGAVMEKISEAFGQEQ